MSSKNIIRIRRGSHGCARYYACNADGSPIMGFDRLSDIRKHWENQIKYGQIELVRELDKAPDMEAVKKRIAALNAILQSYAQK